ncbi:hypothetical protein BC835DRAFT_858009 [Cytidiella melzeri]|nr:hypothetical protein BC835DRAFT_858009 [Cytidiella melzeri]
MALESFAPQFQHSSHGHQHNLSADNSTDMSADNSTDLSADNSTIDSTASSPVRRDDTTEDSSLAKSTNALYPRNREDDVDIHELFQMITRSFELEARSIENNRDFANPVARQLPELADHAPYGIPPLSNTPGLTRRRGKPRRGHNIVRGGSTALESSGHQIRREELELAALLARGPLEEKGEKEERQSEPDDTEKQLDDPKKPERVVIGPYYLWPPRGEGAPPGASSVPPKDAALKKYGVPGLALVGGMSLAWLWNRLHSSSSTAPTDTSSNLSAGNSTDISADNSADNSTTNSTANSPVRRDDASEDPSLAELTNTLYLREDNVDLHELVEMIKRSFDLEVPPSAKMRGYTRRHSRRPAEAQPEHTIGRRASATLESSRHHIRREELHFAKLLARDPLEPGASQWLLDPQKVPPDAEGPFFLKEYPGYAPQSKNPDVPVKAGPREKYGVPGLALVGGMGLAWLWNRLHRSSSTAPTDTSSNLSAGNSTDMSAGNSADNSTTNSTASSPVRRDDASEDPSLAELTNTLYLREENVDIHKLVEMITRSFDVEARSHNNLD